MLVKEWAAREGLHPQTVWKWCREGTMPVPVEHTPTGMWLIHDPKYETRSCATPDGSRTVCYARVSSADQKTDLQRQADRIKTGMWLIHDPKYETRSCATPDGSRTVCYARVSSADQKTDLQRQADRIKAFALSMGVEHPEVVTETGSGMNDKRRKLNRLLADPTVGTVIVEHRDRLARMNFELVENALKAQGRRVIVVDDTELDDDLVRDMTEVLTSFCGVEGARTARYCRGRHGTGR